MSWERRELQQLILPTKGALVSGPFGSNISSRFFVDEGIPVIRGNNLTKGEKKFIDDGFVYLTDEKAAEFSNCIAVTDDIIFTAAGSIGQVGIIPKETRFDHYIISNKQIRARFDKEKVEPMFVYYWLSSSTMTQYLENMNNGGAVPLLNLGIIRKVPVPVPPIEAQKRIIDILSAYDDLIENNRRRIDLLEQSARMLYKEWFVSLRFPGHEHVKVKDGVPQGWEKKRLADWATLVMGQSPASEHYNTDGVGLPFHQGVTNFGDRFVEHKIYCNVEGRIGEAGDILCSVRAPVGRLNITLDRIVLGRGLSAIRSINGYQSFLFYQLKNHFFKEDMIGGGAIFASVTKKDMESQLLLCPTSQLIEDFEQNTKHIDEQLKTLHMQNQKLQQARDLLLPRLMNGEIPV